MTTPVRRFSLVEPWSREVLWRYANPGYTQKSRVEHKTGPRLGRDQWSHDSDGTKEAIPHATIARHVFSGTFPKAVSGHVSREHARVLGVFSF